MDLRVPLVLAAIWRKLKVSFKKLKFSFEFKFAVKFSIG
jgi:hypothetical protein